MIFVGESENGLFRLPNPIKVEINCEMNVPADELNIVFPYASSIPIFRKIYALPDDCDNFRLAVREKNVLFSGIVDEQVYRADADNEEIVFYCRSLAALLLDNECPPTNYVNPSLSIIFQKHIQPFGITVGSFPESIRGGVLNVPKGSSHYAAAEKFCREFLGTVPIIDHKGQFYCSPNTKSELILFDNKDGIPFININVCENRYKRISQIFVSQNNGYDTSVSDEDAQSQGIVRVRFLNLSDSKTKSLSDADEILQKSRKESFSVILNCCGCLIDKIGCYAEVSAPWCRGKKFIVSAVNYKNDYKGEISKVKLITESEDIINVDSRNNGSR